MTYVMDHDVMRFAQFATRVFGCEMNFQNPKATAVEGVERLKQFLTSIGMPINFRELGAKEEDIDYMVEKFGVGDGKTGGFVALDKAAVKEIYRLAL